MKLYHKLIARARALTDADNQALPRWQRALLYALDLGRLGATKLRDDRASQMAAALTYHTLFSLLPTLVLTLVVAQAFISQEELNALKGQAVDWAVQWLESDDAPAVKSPPGLSETSPTFSTGSPADAAATQHRAPPTAQPDGHVAAPTDAQAQAQADAQQIAAERRNEYAHTADQLDVQFQQWLDQLQNVDFRSIGLVGVLIFIYGATKLLSTIEASFNFILRASENRSWYIRLPLYYTTITLAPVVLLTGQWMQRSFLELLGSGGSATGWVIVPLGYISPLMTTWLVLLLAYRLLPNATLKTRAAAIGSFVAAVLLGLAVQGFSFYVRNTGSTSLYGALALLPLFLLLLWVIWQIVLFGIELAVVLQMLPAQRQRRGRKAQHAEMVDPRMLIPVMAVFGEHFEQGQPVNPDLLAEQLTLPNDAATTMIDALVRHGHLHPLESESRAYTLARPPGKIPLTELLALAHHLGRGTQAQNPPALELLDDAERNATQNQTLADLL